MFDLDTVRRFASKIRRVEALPLGFAIVAAAVLVFFSVWGTNFLSLPDELPTTAENGPLSIEALSLFLDAQGQIVSFVTTISLGLFVMLGFALNPDRGRRSRLGVLDAVAGAFFLGFSFAAIYFGYASRSQGFEYSLHVYPDYQTMRPVFLSLREITANQALCTGLAAVCAIFITVRSVLPGQATTVKSGDPKGTGERDVEEQTK